MYPSRLPGKVVFEGGEVNFAGLWSADADILVIVVYRVCGVEYDFVALIVEWVGADRAGRYGNTTGANCPSEGTNVEGI